MYLPTFTEHNDLEYDLSVAEVLGFEQIVRFFEGVVRVTGSN